MGTPEFAVASLDALVNSSHTICGVVTVADGVVFTQTVSGVRGNIKCCH